jgi:D-alanyl-D-alanine endopeptidase (penicillin-binding protein 7)
MTETTLPSNKGWRRLLDRGRVVLAVALAGGCSLLQGARSMQRLALHSAAGIVQDQRTGELIFEKASGEVLPIASITKLVTAMVVLDANLDLNEPITILEEDKDTLRHSKSHLQVGTRLTRGEALHVALMSSENRAAHALGRTYPSGLAAFVAAMNAKAHALGLASTHFEDPAGLDNGNVSCARDLAKVVDQAHHYARIREFSTSASALIPCGRGVREFHNTNMLIESSRWHIGLSKTGFIEESGQCLVMQAQLAQRPVVIVLLDANGRHSRFDDANRIRAWMEGPEPVRVAHRRRRRR